MIFRHLLVWATIWLGHVQAQKQPVLERSIVLDKPRVFLVAFTDWAVHGQTHRPEHGAQRTTDQSMDRSMDRTTRKPLKRMNGKSSSFWRIRSMIWIVLTFLLGRFANWCWVLIGFFLKRWFDLLRFFHSVRENPSSCLKTLFSGKNSEEEPRLFRFEWDAYYREVYKWYLRDGTKYFDGKCGDRITDNPTNEEVQACRRSHWNSTAIQAGEMPKFFGIMEGMLYPTVSYINYCIATWSLIETYFIFKFLIQEVGIKQNFENYGQLRTIRISNKIYQ